jgi:hypothetical protein
VGIDPPVTAPASPAEGEAAEPGQRVVARIIDTLVVGVPVALITTAAVPRANAQPLATVAVGALLLLYEFVQLALWGRTLGKRLMGIAVRAAGPDGNDDAEAGGARNGGAVTACTGTARAGAGGPGLGRSLLRSALYALPIVARPVPILGVIADILWVANAVLLVGGPGRQVLSDRIARTSVVRTGA